MSFQVCHGTRVPTEATDDMKKHSGKDQLKAIVVSFAWGLWLQVQRGLPWDYSRIYTPNSNPFHRPTGYRREGPSSLCSLPSVIGPSLMLCLGRYCCPPNSCLPHVPHITMGTHAHCLYSHSHVIHPAY